MASLGDDWMMAKHVCDWRWFVDYVTPSAGFKCRCGEQMDLDQAQDMLNECVSSKAEIEALRDKVKRQKHIINVYRKE